MTEPVDFTDLLEGLELTVAEDMLSASISRAALFPIAKADMLPDLVGGARVFYRADFLNPAVANWCYELLAPNGGATVPWERRRIVIYGRDARESRETAFYGDEGAHYYYSGVDHPTLPWGADRTGVLAALRDAASASARSDAKPDDYNLVLMNKYGPRDSIGRHSDDERGLDRAAGVFSISLGQERTFHLEPKGRLGKAQAVKLGHGSAIWMAGDTQSLYKHCIEPEPALAKPGASPFAFRINLTFRRVLLAA